MSQTSFIAFQLLLDIRDFVFISSFLCLFSSDDMSRAKMNDGHRLFLQSFMSRGILNAKEVRQLFKICCLKYQSNITLKHYI